MHNNNIANLITSVAIYGLMVRQKRCSFDIFTVNGICKTDCMHVGMTVSVCFTISHAISFTNQSVFKTFRGIV